MMSGKMFIDIVFPDGNEAEFISMAERLGYSGLCFVYDDKKKLSKLKNLVGELQKKTKIKLYVGFLATYKNLGKAREFSDFVLVSSSQKDGIIIEKMSFDLLFNQEAQSGKDFIYSKNSGLNHIMCRFASQRKIIIGFSFSMILNSETRQQVFGRITQNIKLCRKYKTKTVIASFTKEPYEMRPWHDLISLFVCLGMHQKEAKDSLKNASLRIEENIKKRESGYVAEGVRVVK